MSCELLSISRVYSLLALASMVMASVSAQTGAGSVNDNNKFTSFTVLYAGPLVHDQNWTITFGPPSSLNQASVLVGGTCSMVPHDVHEALGSSTERVTFEAERQDLGVWSMVWSDTVSGRTMDGNRYTYQARRSFSGVTNDGRPPQPSRAHPSPGNDGFLGTVPDNVNTDSIEINDFFLLQSAQGNILASSHVHWRLRQQIPPVASDPPPAFYPFIIQGRYIANIHEQVGGQLGCDPL